MSKPEPNAEPEIAHQEQPVLQSAWDILATATGEISTNLDPVIDTIPTLAWCNLADGRNEFVNKRWYEYTGMSPEEAHGWGWKAAIHPEDLPRLMQIWEVLPEPDKSIECEARLRRSDGVFRCFLFRCQARRDSTGAVARWWGTASDVEDQKQADTLRDAEMRALEMITDGASLTDILNHLCASIDLQISPSITTILLMDPDGKRLWPTAGPKVPPDWTRAIAPLAVAPDTGLCGTAAFLKTRVIVPDVASEPVWREDLRGIALTNGIRAAWSQPILTNDSQVLGTFAIYSAKSRVATDTELALIEGSGRIALIAIERQGSQEALRTALDEIRNSEARLRKIIDTIPTLAWCSLPDGTGIFWNRRWHEYTGLPLKAVRGWGWQDAIHPEDLNEITDKWLGFLNSGQPGEVEGRLRRFDGAYRWFLFRAEPLRNESGNIINWYGTDTDIEDLKRAEAKLRRDEEELRRMTDVIPETIIVLNPDGRAIYANRVALEYTGLSLDDVRADDFRARVFHPDDVQRVREERQKALSGTAPFENEQRKLGKDGKYRWFLIRYNPLLDESGKVIRWYVAGTDIEDRKQVEELLRREQDELRAKHELLELAQRAAHAMAFDWYIQKDVNTWSPGQEALYGLSPGTFDGKYETWKKLIHPDDWPLIVNAVKHSHETGNISAEFRVVWPDGSVHWLAARGQMFMDAEGRPYRMVGFTADITQRKVAEEALRRNEGYLAEAQKLTRSGSWAWNRATNHTYWSEETFRIYGFPLETTPSRELFQQRVHPDDLAIVEAAGDILLTKDLTVFDFRLLLPNNSLKYIHSVAQAVKDANGQVIEFQGTAMDVTDRKLAEDALRRNEASLLEAQRLSHTGSWTHDVLTGRVTVSPEILRIFDVKGDDTSTTDFFRDRIHPDDWPKVEASHNRALTAKIDFESDYRIVLPDGSIKYIHNVGHPKLSDSGQLLEYVGTTMDVTEQHNARTALEHAFEEIKTLKDRLQKENIALREDIARSSMFEEIVGSSPVLNKVLAEVEKVASTDSTVLILGETGTGKELIARAIHNRSKRANCAFATVNCAAIPPSLIASELFGHEKGAFTGAMQRRIGRFESADSGTIFLDEIGELPPETQVALLRVLQERQFERLGGHQTISVDVRVLAATNRDLAGAVAEGAFRQDLFYRLNVFPIQLPALRDRAGDIPLLLQYLVERYAHKAGKKIRNISKKTLDLFQSYSWPGNVRELQNVVERAVILCEGETFSVDASWLPAVPAGYVSTTAPLVSDLARREKTIIENALREAQGRISGPAGAAAKLGLPRQTLESKMQRLGIKRNRFKISSF